LIATCVYTTGSQLKHPARGSFYTERSAFPLVLGKKYPILGMGLFEGALIVLANDETGPNWLPIGLFDISPQAIPRDWQFVLLDGLEASGGKGMTTAWEARWGYYELVHDPGHFENLINREPDALRIFQARLEKLSKSF
jgi:hypothetical protein